jgi:toxin ParE1/3/4
VARVRYQRRAEDDLDAIADYSLERWGQAQAERYVNELQALCEHLDELPVLNRPHRGPYLRRTYQSHVVFFRHEDDGGILIVRILHGAMLPELHSFEDDEDDA